MHNNNYVAIVNVINHNSYLLILRPLRDFSLDSKVAVRITAAKN